MSTLRYADRAKRIVNHAIVNEDPNARLIRELREEVDRLRAQLGMTGEVKDADELARLRDMLKESENLMAELNMTWEEKVKRAEQSLQSREQALQEMGISLVSGGLAIDKSKFYLVNLNADPSMNELLVYYLKVNIPALLSLPLFIPAVSTEDCC